MRPRKVILVFCESIENSMELKFLLETRGRYEVVIAEDFEQAQALMKNDAFDFRMIVGEVGRTGQANCLAKDFRTIPSLLFSRMHEGQEVGYFADYFIPKMFCTSEEILDRVAIMSARRRGPQKATVAA